MAEALKAVTTARLPRAMHNRLKTFSAIKKKSKSEIIKDALELYFDREDGQLDSYTLGKEYFGKYSSGESDLSVTCKERIRKKLHEKYKHSAD